MLFLYLKVWCIGSEIGYVIGMLGSYSDIRVGFDFFNSLVWLGGILWRYYLWFEGFEFFLVREYV